MLVPCLQCRNPVFVSASALGAGSVQAKCTSCRSALIIEKGGAVRLASPPETAPPPSVVVAPPAEIAPQATVMPEYAPDVAPADANFYVAVPAPEGPLPEIPSEAILESLPAAEAALPPPALPEFAPAELPAYSPSPVLIAAPEPELGSVPPPAMIIPPPPHRFAAAVEAPAAPEILPQLLAPPAVEPVVLTQVKAGREPAPAEEPTFVLDQPAAAPALPAVAGASAQIVEAPESAVGPATVPASEPATVEPWSVQVHNEAVVLQYLRESEPQSEPVAATVELAQTVAPGAEAWSVSSGVHRLSAVVGTESSVTSLTAVAPAESVEPPIARSSPASMIGWGLGAAAAIAVVFTLAFNSSRRAQDEAASADESPRAAAPAAVTPAAAPTLAAALAAPTPDAEISKRPGELASAQLGTSSDDARSPAPAEPKGPRSGPTAKPEPTDDPDDVPGTAPAPVSANTGTKVRASSRDVQACYQKGNRLLNQKKVTVAIKELNRCVELDPLFGKTYRSLGVAQMLLGREKTAIQAYEKFVEYEPQHKDVPKVREIIADYYKRRGK